MKINLEQIKKHIKKKKKLLIGLTVLIVVIILSILFRLPIAKTFNSVATNLAYNNYTSFTKSVWEFSYNNPVAKEYRYKNGELSIVEELNYEENIPLEFGQEEIKDENLIAGMQYIIEGVEGKDIYKVRDLKKVKDGFEEVRNLSRVFKEKIEPESKKIVTGSKTKEEFVQIVNTKIQELISKSSENEEINNLVVNKIDQEYKASLVKNITVGEIKYLESENPKSTGTIKIANLQIIYQPCNYFTFTTFVYDLDSKSYKFEDLNKFFKVLCNGIGSSVLGEIATCDDCNLFPVDKTKRLLSSYKPPVQKVDIQNSTEVWLHKDAIRDFLELSKAVKAAGHNLNITSGYRSYQKQVETFEFWVQREIRLFGYSRARAEQEANKYSAIPGFSEHQLGTTVDMNTIDCEAFDGYCQPNENMWAWLGQNAWKYGFVLSYPEGREADTGYVSEKWHYRWLGKDLAKEFQSQNFKLTLNKWLVMKGMY